MTLCASPVAAGIGHTAQNSEVLLLKVLPCPGMPTWVSFESSQERNSSSLVAVVSYLIVREPPQPAHLHLCLPAVVRPFFFILVPQAGQMIISAVDDHPHQTCDHPISHK